MNKYYIVLFLFLVISVVCVSSVKQVDKNTHNVIGVEKKNEEITLTPYETIIPPHAIMPSRIITIKKTVKRFVNIIATAYTDSVEETGNSHGFTASGKKVSRGMIASPHNVPFGTVIHVEGMGDFTVEDRGNPKYIRWIDYNTIRIDIFMEDKQDAINFGVRKLKGYIVVEDGGE